MWNATRITWKIVWLQPIYFGTVLISVEIEEMQIYALQIYCLSDSRRWSKDGHPSLRMSSFSENCPTKE